MKTSSKLKITKITTLVMITTILGILVWFIGYLITSTFDLNVFDNKASDLLFATFGGAFILVSCSAILNVSLNISIIAEKNLVLDESESTSINFKKILLITLAAIIIVTLFLFGGDFLSRRQIKQKFISEGDGIVSHYSETIKKIEESLLSNEDIISIPGDLQFLSKIKSEFPSVIIITSDTYNSELTFLKITQWTSEEDLLLPYYNGSFYSTSNNDFDYLYNVFSNNQFDTYLWYEDNDYNYYIPFENGEKPFVLLFSKYENYGKIGSGSYR